MAAEPPPSDRPARPPPLPTLPRRPPEGPAPASSSVLPPLSATPMASPIPSSTNPMAVPAAGPARASSVGDDDGEGAETTRPVQTPNAAALVDEIVELVSYEAEALLTVGETVPDADERLADLNVRLSLVTWDVLEDAED